MNDLLKREKVLRTIQKMFECCTTYDIIDYRDLMTEAIKVLPPERQLNLNRPQGEWVYCEEDDSHLPEDGRYGIFKCSNCGSEQSYPISEGSGRVYGDNYCPNCGARMKGADDEIS